MQLVGISGNKSLCDILRLHFHHVNIVSLSKLESGGFLSMEEFTQVLLVGGTEVVHSSMSISGVPPQIIKFLLVFVTTQEIPRL